MVLFFLTVFTANVDSKFLSPYLYFLCIIFLFYATSSSILRPMGNSNTRLVYSTDPTKVKCPRCGEYTPGCACVTLEKITDPSKITVKLRFEKAGRAGKTVTVLFDLPKDPEYLRDLAKKLKAGCGTG